MAKDKSRGEWNFGPEYIDHLTVEEIVELASIAWGAESSWTTKTNKTALAESPTLRLNIEKARKSLGFSTKFSAAQAVQGTIEWELDVLSGVQPNDATRGQVDNYLKLG